MTIAEQMVPELTRETAMTRRLLSRIPPGQLGFTPGHGLHTVGWNASHLAEIVGWVPGIVGADSLDLSAMPAGYAPAPEDDLPAILRAIDGHLPRALASLAGATDATMAEPWSLKMGGQVLFTMPKGDCLRKWVFAHTAHHRGILCATLRLAGAELGSIYEE